MTKRLTKIFLLVIAVIFALSSCSAGVTQKEYNKVVQERDKLQEQVDTLTVLLSTLTGGDSLSDNANEDSGNGQISLQDSEAKDETSGTSVEKASTAVFDEETVIAQLEVTSYQYVSSIKTPWLFIVIKNNSDFDLDISIDLKTYDTQGNINGAKSKSQEAFENNTETIIAFMLDEKPASFDYEISAEEEDWYECVVSDLSFETISAKDKEIVSVTNNADKAAEFVECTILFFMGDEVVDYERTYVVDDDSEIKPGKTITKELKSYEDYDSFKIYFAGRR